MLKKARETLAGFVPGAKEAEEKKKTQVDLNDAVAKARAAIDAALAKKEKDKRAAVAAAGDSE